MRWRSLAWVVLLSVALYAQTLTTVTGTIKDLAGNVVQNGQVTFDLKPGVDTTISGQSRFVPTTITCQIVGGAIASITRASNVVTATLTAAPSPGFFVGATVEVSGVADSSFDGGFVLTAASGTSLSWAENGSDASSTGGAAANLYNSPAGGVPTGACQVTYNTALTPAGTYYLVTEWPEFVSGPQFNWYAASATQDISTVVPTPATAPAYTFLSTTADQRVSGDKRFAEINGVYSADQFCSPGAMDQSCVLGALSAIGTPQATLFIPSGNYAIGANLTIPSNVTLQFARGAIWTVAVPYVVQINGPLLAGNYQIFSTTLPTQTTGSMTAASPTLTTTGLSVADVGSAVYVAGTSATSVMIPVNDVLGMGSGNGTQTVFTYTAAHVPINANSVDVSDAVVRGSDNGTGIISPVSPPFTAGIAGTVNYTTGAISVTFTPAPAAGTILQIGYSYATKEPTVGTISSVASATSATLSFSAASTASNAMVMFGGSYVKFGSGYVGSLNPMWWGAVGDGSTDSAAALQASMTACGEAQLPLSVPSGTYITNVTLDAGDPFQLGFYNASSAEVGGSCSIVGQPGGAVFGQRNPATFQAAAGFSSGSYVLQRENAAALDWENFYVNGSNTGANGIDAAWLWIPGTPSPATSSRLVNVNIFNFGRMGADLDNWNDAIIRDVIVAQPSGTTPIDFQLEGAGGKIDLSQNRFYGGIARLDAQNGDIIGGGFYDGLELTGQGRDDITLQGPQIFANTDTGIALDSTNTSSDGVDDVFCSACYFVATTGQTYIAGRFGRAIAFNGTGFTGTGSPTFFGTISTAIANGPTFLFDGGDGGIPAAAPNLGQVILRTSANTTATITSAPAQFESLTTPTTGYICLGSGTCNKTTNFALGVNATGDLIASGADTPVYVGHDSLSASYNVISLNGQAGDVGAMGLFGGKSTDQNLYVVSPGNISWRPGGVTTNVLTVSTSGINIGGGQTIASSSNIALTTQLPLTGTTPSIGGAALAAGACTTGTVAITGATTAMAAVTSPITDPGAGIAWQAWVSTAGTVTVRLCNRTSGSLTPVASAYDVRVVQ